MNAPLLFQIIAGLVFVLFTVALIMGFKSWRIHTIMMVVLVFLAAMTFMVLSGMVLRTHAQWRLIAEGPPGAHKQGLIFRTEDQIQKNYERQFGRRRPDGTLIEDGIVQKQQKLRRELYDRGRVWFEVEPKSANESNVEVTIANPKPVGINVNSPVYVFDANPTAADGAYLGEFRVTSVEDPAAGDAEAGDAEPEPAGPVPTKEVGGATVTLEGAWNLSEDEQKRLEVSANKGGPWRIYEKMPPDRHDVFSQLHNASADELGVDPAELPKLNLEGRLTKLLPENVVTQYINDYQKPTEDTPAEQIEVLVRFSQEYVVNSEGEEELKFNKRSEVWLPKEPMTAGEGDDQATIMPGADQLAEEGVVKVLDTRYARPLRDYSLLFRKIFMMRDLKVARNKAIQYDLDAVTKISQQKKEDVDRSKQEQQRLVEDRSGYQRDEQKLDQLIAEMAQQKKELQSLASKLYKQNITLVLRLDRAQMEAVKRLNRRAPAPQAQSEPATTPDVVSSN